MRVLLIHNKYQYAGGEDKVFEAESELLSINGHQIEQIIFDNRQITTFTARMSAALLGVYNYRSAKLVATKIQRFRPDVIHVHNFVPLASPSVLFAARRHKIPVVLTLHNYRLICPSATLYHNNAIYEKSMRSLFPLDAILKGVYRNSVVQTAALALMTCFHNLSGTWRNKVAKFIVLTEFARSKFLESRLRVSADQFMMKPNFIADPGNGNESREDFFLYVGRLSQEKGIDTLLNAFRSSSLKLVIIGDGPMQQHVEKFIQTRSNVQYLGFQSKAAIMDHLKRAKALIIPSTWYEGFPITVLEAFATGTPVIGSRLGGLAEIVKHKFNGLLFEAGNKDSLIETVEMFQSVDRKTLSKNARTTYLDNYTPEKNYRILMDIYTKAMNRNEHGT